MFDLFRRPLTAIKEGMNRVYLLFRRMDPMTNELRLNVGCGTDYREGFINIDGSSTISKVDKRLDFKNGELLNEFQADSVDFILAQDIIEHFYLWEARSILKDFYSILKPGGRVQIRVPDCEFIIRFLPFTLEEKLTWLYGGQSIERNVDQVMDASRKEHPEYFCHKYGWSRERLRRELGEIGFQALDFSRRFSGKNLTVRAQKLA